MCTAARRRLTDITCVQFRLKQPIKPVIWEPKKNILYILNNSFFHCLLKTQLTLHICVQDFYMTHIFPEMMEDIVGLIRCLDVLVGFVCTFDMAIFSSMNRTLRVFPIFEPHLGNFQGFAMICTWQVPRCRCVLLLTVYPVAKKSKS